MSDKLMGIVSVVIAAGSVVVLLLTVTGVTVLWRFCKRRFECCRKLDKWRKGEANQSPECEEQTKPMLQPPDIRVAINTESSSPAKQTVDLTQKDHLTVITELPLGDDTAEITLHVPPRPGQLDLPAERSRSSPGSRVITPVLSNKLCASNISTPSQSAPSKSSSVCSSVTQKSRTDQKLSTSPAPDVSSAGQMDVDRQSLQLANSANESQKDVPRIKSRPQCRDDSKSPSGTSEGSSTTEKRSSREARQAFQRQHISSLAVDEADDEPRPRDRQPSPSSSSSSQHAFAKQQSFDERRVSLDYDADLHGIQAGKHSRSASGYARHAPRMCSVREELEDDELARQQKYIAMWSRKAAPHDEVARERKYADMWRKRKQMRDTRTCTIESDCFDVQRGARTRMRGQRLGDMNATYSLDDSLEPPRSSRLEVPPPCGAYSQGRGRIDSGYRSHSGLSSKSATIDSDDAFCEAFVPPPPTPNRQPYKALSMCADSDRRVAAPEAFADPCIHPQPYAEPRNNPPTIDAARNAVERWQRHREQFGKMRCQSEVHDFHQLVTQALDHERRQKRRLPVPPCYSARPSVDLEYPLTGLAIPVELRPPREQHLYVYQPGYGDVPLSTYPMQ